MTKHHRDKGNKNTWMETKMTKSKYLLKQLHLKSISSLQSLENELVLLWIESLNAL